MARFRILTQEECLAIGLDEASEIYDGEYRNFLVEFDVSGDPIRLVAVDGGEPEDQTLCRDLSWVVEELNALAELLP